MKGYYQEKLASEKLLKVYDIAPFRVQQYLNAELDHVLKKIRPQDAALDLGCGYGRIIPQLARKAKFVVGIDTSYASLIMGKKMLTGAGPGLWLWQNHSATGAKSKIRRRH